MTIQLASACLETLPADTIWVLAPPPCPWVVDRLRRDPVTRSAAITTFQPHTDTSYIPCVSLLDFWLPDGAVELIAYAHSIDFGAKGYGNLVELAALQQHVARQLGRPAARPGGC